MRPLYDIKVAKVYIVKWAQNWSFVDGNAFFGLPYDFEIKLKTAILQICGYPRNETSGHKNLIPRPQYNRYFCHIAIIKWSQIYKKNPSESVLYKIFFWIHFL